MINLIIIKLYILLILIAGNVTQLVEYSPFKRRVISSNLIILVLFNIFKYLRFKYIK